MPKPSFLKTTIRLFWLVCFTMMTHALVGQICRPPSAADLEASTEYVAAFSSSTVSQIHLISSEQSVFGCIWELHYLLDQRQVGATYYLSEDRHYLVSSIYDLRIAPAVAKHYIALRANKNLLGNALGSKGAVTPLVTIIEFMDFQCPYCAALYNEISLEVERDTTLRVVMHNFPLPIHSWARVAAQMAVCASRQGPSLFWNMAQFFFTSQPQLTPETVVEQGIDYLGHSEGFDKTTFSTCLNTEAVSQEVDRDIVRGKLNGVHATPSFLVNGVLYQGARTTEQLHRIIADAERDAKSLIRPDTPPLAQQSASAN